MLLKLTVSEGYLLKFRLANSSHYSASKEGIDKTQSNGKSQPELSYNLVL